MSTVFHGDRPIQTAEQDYFGFGPLAQRIAEALTSQSAAKGFVLGIEGKWGSGKSSLLALTMGKLAQMRGDEVTAVEFRPWLIGDREQLLVALFEDIIKAISQLEQAGDDPILDNKNITIDYSKKNLIKFLSVRKIIDNVRSIITGFKGGATLTTQQIALDATKKKVRKFASHLGPVGKLAGLAGLALPGFSIAGQALEAISGVAKELEEGPTLAQQKDTLSEALINLNCRIVVAIDDVDRLEPKEVAELLRLVRSVADFPNISYILCYDSSALTKAIEVAMGVSDGRAFLEKIVQAEVGVPHPESFALRRWFSDELATFATCRPEISARLMRIIDEAGGRAFDTARMVVRVLDSLRVFWPHLEGKVDLPDLVWLRIFAVAHPHTYRWIEEYLTEMVAISVGRVTLTSENKHDCTAHMEVALAQDGLSWESMKYEFGQQLPGLNIHAKGNERFFVKKQRISSSQDILDGRLASLNHSRLYFALAGQPDCISGIDIESLLALTFKGCLDLAQAQILEMAHVRGDTGATKAERLFDELRTYHPLTTEDTHANTLALAITNSADDLSKNETGENWGYPRIWYLARTIIKRLIEQLSGSSRSHIIDNVFKNGSSIGFLSYLLRNETFGHGFYGNKVDFSDRLVTKEEFEQIRIIMLNRFEQMGLAQVLKELNGVTILYAWSQAGGREILQQLIIGMADSDVWLISFLKLISTTRVSNNDTQSVLTFESMENFFPAPKEILLRVQALAKANPPVNGAQEIIDAFEFSLIFSGSSLDEVLSEPGQHDSSTQ